LKSETIVNINRSFLILTLVVFLILAGCIASATNQLYTSAKTNSTSSKSTFLVQPHNSHYYIHTTTNNEGYKKSQTPGTFTSKNFSYSRGKSFYFEEQQGSIQVDSIPSGALVILDGKNTGKTTPTTIDGITVGNHTILCRLKGFTDESQTVVVNVGKNTIVKFNIGDQKGSIQVDSIPSGALVILDGRSTGKLTPTTLSDVTIGNHTILCKIDGYGEHSQNIVVNGDQTTTISLDCRDTPIGSIYVDSVPSGAGIYLDGFDMDYKTPATLSTISAGNHTILCKMNGYPDKSQTVVVNSRQTTSVLITFENPNGSIYVRSIPSDAKIYLDGTDTGYYTPATLTNIQIGGHIILCKMTGFTDQFQSVVVNGDRTSSVIFNFMSEDRTGSISVTSIPSGALIFMDGKSTGKTTPNTIDGIPIGDHSIRCTMDGYADSLDGTWLIVSVYHDTISKVEFTLAKLL
jgi:hypothetical protein